MSPQSICTEMRDRVVQTALRNVIEPIFERDFAEHSYGFRPRRGAKDAWRRVEELLKEGYHWVVDADIKGYFDSIPHQKLMAKVAQKISDGRIIELTESYLKAGVMEQSKGWEPTEQGTPQGGRNGHEPKASSRCAKRSESERDATTGTACRWRSLFSPLAPVQNFCSALSD